jgi:hypothetical protein
MVKRNRRRPGLKVTGGGTGIVNHAGARLLADLADRVGLTTALSAAMAPTKQRRRGHDRGEAGRCRGDARRWRRHDQRCRGATRSARPVRLCAHLAPDGRIVVGFGAERGYEFDDFFADVASVGLRDDLRLSTWDLRPFDDASSSFLVAILTSR